MAEVVAVAVLYIRYIRLGAPAELLRPPAGRNSAGKGAGTEREGFNYGRVEWRDTNVN